MNEADPPPQMGLFGEPAVHSAASIAAPAADPQQQRWAERLGSGLTLGCSSWSFPGWESLVYRGRHASALLSRQGLPAYACHPLLNGVSIDRSFYGPLRAGEYAHYAAQVPDDFRFVVKAWRHPLQPVVNGRINPDFLHAPLAQSDIVEPAKEGLSGKLHALLFQFSALSLGQIQGKERFFERLSCFLSDLDPELRYFVEVRNAELLGPELRAALDAAGAHYALNLMPNMPDLDQQFRSMQLQHQSSYLVRWLLAPGWSYQDAKRDFAPFNTLVCPQPKVRARLVSWIRWAQSQNRHFALVVNNKAEGSSPRSIEELVRELVEL